MEEEVIARLPVDRDSIEFNGWHIEYTKSNILKSICAKGPGECCKKDEDALCELCVFRHSLDLPHLPDMVFHKNTLKLAHSDGAKIEFLPIESLKSVEDGKQAVQVACANEWQETRPESLMEKKFKPFDWTFTTEYQGNLNDKFRIESTNSTLNKFKLMQREKILFYEDLTLFEDELHDNGISSCSVKIRVMPSGFYILLRNFLRVDNVLLKIYDTRFHYEIENTYIFKEFTKREATYEELKSVPAPYFTMPNEIEQHMPIKEKKAYKLHFT